MSRRCRTSSPVRCSSPFPNEKEAALLAKTLAAKVLRGDRDQRYRPIEFVNAVLGRMDRVSRLEPKGFDHARLAGLLRRHFREVEVEGVGLGPLPVGSVRRPVKGWAMLTA